MKTVLFYPTFLLQNYAVRKGEASLVTQLEDTQAQDCDLLVKQNKKYKTDEETYSYPPVQVIPSQVGTIIWRTGGIIIGGPEIMGMWPPIGGLIPGAGPPGIIPGGEGPITGIVGIPIASKQPGNDSYTQADKGGQRTKTSAMMGQKSMILRSVLF